MPLKTHQSRGVAIAEALATATIWGTTFVATKIALEEVSPATVVWLRFGMGLLVLGLAAGLRGELSLPRSGDWAQLALLGFIGVALHQWLQANGLRTAAATTTAWIVASTPLFISLLAWLVLDERPSSIQWIGIGIAALGVVLVVSRGDPASLGLGRAIGVGDLLVLISAPNWAIYTILSRRLLSSGSPTKMMLLVLLFGWIFVTIWAMGFGPGFREFGALSQRGWIAIVGLGVLGSGLAYIMYYDALQILPASQLGVFLNVEPLVTMLLAVPVLGERITAAIPLGGAMIITGIILVNRVVSASAHGSSS